MDKELVEMFSPGHNKRRPGLFQDGEDEDRPAEAWFITRRADSIYNTPIWSRGKFKIRVKSPNGKIGFVGIPEEKDPIFKIDRPLEDFIFKNVEVHAILGRRFPFDWEASGKP